ncbi:hypothetical protein [Halobacillus sp. B29]|uniref:hypothetical protein n=1 Tax=Halobacillus sp. B29 TaxID=3457432 RepID=UPI003FCE8BEF
MERKFKVTRNIDIVLILSLAVYVFVTGFTAAALPAILPGTIIFSMTIIRGLESWWRGSKLAGGIAFSFSLICLFAILLILLNG